MNRLSPWIARRLPDSPPAFARAAGAGRARAAAIAAPLAAAGDDLDLFVTAFLGGFVFFSTLFA